MSAVMGRDNSGSTAVAPVESSVKGTTKPSVPVYACEVCGKVFGRRSNLSCHQRLHSGEKPFTCPECQRPFTHHSSLKHHLRLHTGERPYQCSSCPRTFRQRPNYTLHLKTHTGEKHYRCHTCGKEFAQRVHLTAHSRLHSGDLPYACQDCGRRFPQQSHLTRHRDMRGGEAKHLCHLCGGRFFSRSCLRSHTRTHEGGTHAKGVKRQSRIVQRLQGEDLGVGGKKTKGESMTWGGRSQGNEENEDRSKKGVGDSTEGQGGDEDRDKGKAVGHRPKREGMDEDKGKDRTVDRGKRRKLQSLECEVCHKTFHKPSHLLHHRLTHTGEQPHQCPQCGRRFSQARSLRRHILALHIKARFSHIQTHTHGRNRLLLTPTPDTKHTHGRSTPTHMCIQGDTTPTLTHTERYPHTHTHDKNKLSLTPTYDTQHTFDKSAPTYTHKEGDAPSHTRTDRSLHLLNTPQHTHDRNTPTQIHSEGNITTLKHTERSSHIQHIHDRQTPTQIHSEGDADTSLTSSSLKHDSCSISRHHHVTGKHLSTSNTKTSTIDHDSNSGEPKSDDIMPGATNIHLTSHFTMAKSMEVEPSLDHSSLAHQHSSAMNPQEPHNSHSPLSHLEAVLSGGDGRLCVVHSGEVVTPHLTKNRDAETSSEDLFISNTCPPLGVRVTKNGGCSGEAVTPHLTKNRDSETSSEEFLSVSSDTCPPLGVRVIKIGECSDSLSGIYQTGGKGEYQQDTPTSQSLTSPHHLRKPAEKTGKQNYDPSVPSFSHSDQILGSCQVKTHDLTLKKDPEHEVIKAEVTGYGSEDLAAGTREVDGRGKQESKTDQTNRLCSLPLTAQPLVAVSLFLFGKRVKEETEEEEEVEGEGEVSVKEELEMVEEAV